MRASTLPATAVASTLASSGSAGTSIPMARASHSTTSAVSTKRCRNFRYFDFLAARFIIKSYSRRRAGLLTARNVLPSRHASTIRRLAEPLLHAAAIRTLVSSTTRFGRGHHKSRAKVLKRKRTAFGRTLFGQKDYSFRIPDVITSIVRSISASPWAALRKHVSKAEGGRYTPSSRA